MARRYLGGIFALAMLCIAGRSLAVESRVALVIGNGFYQNAPALSNPSNDATDIAKSLERLGFWVRRVDNGTFEQMRQGVLAFGQKARAAEIALVYFAGHGIEMGGENWLIPVDATLRADADVPQEAIALKSVTGAASGASRLGLVILDACRINPFAAKMQKTFSVRSAVSRGLSRVEPAGGVLVAYSAKDGTIASDGQGRNSPFTASLLRHLETPGLEISFLFRNVRDDVLAETNREQEPFTYGSLSKEAIFLKAAFTPEGSSFSTGPTADEAAWSLIKDSSNIELMTKFIRHFPDSRRRADAQERINKLSAMHETAPAPAVPTVKLPIAPTPKLRLPQAKRTSAYIKQNFARRGNMEQEIPERGKRCFSFNGKRVCD